MDNAKHVATNIRKRLDEVSTMVRRDPALVRVVTGNGGDQIAMWRAEDGTGREYNVSAAQRQLSGLVEVHGQEILRTRRGQIAPVSFKFLGLS